MARDVSLSIPMAYRKVAHARAKVAIETTVAAVHRVSVVESLLHLGRGGTGSLVAAYCVGPGTALYGQQKDPAESRKHIAMVRR
jgi:hypothetical protein